MPRWWRRGRRSRAALIERKHLLEGEINVVSDEVRRRRARGDESGDLEARLERLRSQHYRTRLEIDRSPQDPPA